MRTGRKEEGGAGVELEGARGGGDHGLRFYYSTVAGESEYFRPLESNFFPGYFPGKEEARRE